MSFNSNTVKSIGLTYAVSDLQRLQPTGDQRRQKRGNPEHKRRPRAEVVEFEQDVDTTVYTPEGQVEGDEHGVRLDISA